MTDRSATCGQFSNLLISLLALRRLPTCTSCPRNCLVQFLSFNMVNDNVPLGRESALFVRVQREKSVTFIKKAPHPPAACDMKREKTSPMQSLGYGCACAKSKIYSKFSLLPSNFSIKPIDVFSSEHKQAQI